MQCAFWTGKCGKEAAVSAVLSPPRLLASQQCALLMSRVQTPPAPLSVLVDLPAGKGACQGEGPLVWTFHPLQIPPRDTSPIPMPPPTLFCHYTLLHGDLSCSFGYIRDLLPPGFCENCSTCRYIFDVFVGRR